MIKASYLSISTIPLIALASSGFLTTPTYATGTGAVEVTCELKTSVPTVIATLSNQNVSQVTPILSFLPEYFSANQALKHCQSSATKLNTFYHQERMNYLASDTIGGNSVVCAVERRGLGCNSYNSDVLFTVDKVVPPSELLYNMLGKDFKGSNLPLSRTVSRIYTDLRPLWWPFDF